MLQTIENTIDRIEISSRQIAESTGKNHAHVKRDIENALQEDVSKFGCIYLDTMNRKQTEYILPKNIALGVASGYSFDLRMKIINRLDELEKIVNKPLTYEQTMQNALLLADNRVKELEHKIIADKPLTDFGRAVSNSDATISVAIFAKTIQDKLNISFGRNKAFDWLRKEGYLFKKGNGNQPYQRWIDLGLFTVGEHLRQNSTYQTIDVVIGITGKGQEYLFDKISLSMLLEGAN